MDDVKRGAREVENTAREAGRELDGHDLGDDIGNAGDGPHGQPTQARLDACTLRRPLGTLDGRRVTVVGDVLHSRVARSNAPGASRSSGWSQT